jgi:imidazolonepropionase-like amidohydrolase
VDSSQVKSGLGRKQSRISGKLHESGVSLAAGADFLDSPLMKPGNDDLELEMLVKYCGSTPIGALVPATRNGSIA